VRQHVAVLLEPNHGRYDSRVTRWRYAGSSVEIGPDDVCWTPPTHRGYHRGGFTVAIGAGPGQAHAVTKIQTAFPSRFDLGLVDQYVVTDSAGTVLGSFPSGFGLTDSALPEHGVGWYPVPVVRAAVEAAGLVWDDRDFLGDAAKLEAAFPGAVKHLRARHRMAWVQSVLYAVYGVAFLAGGVAWIVAEGLVRFPFPFILILVGSLALSVGVMSAPPMLRRARDRRAASRA
jgi:hypothetical protein